MKQSKAIFAAATLAAALIPGVSFAGTEAEALEQCALEMTDDINARVGSPVKVRIDDTGVRASRRLKSTAVFYLHVSDAETGDVISRVDCFVDKHARVQYINEQPLVAAVSE